MLIFAYYLQRKKHAFEGSKYMKIVNQNIRHYFLNKFAIKKIFCKQLLPQVSATGW